ncbi:hypothetical protein PhCBS80983_g01711 [Powellomyces hirtus]|uniref:Uncharacterized protein n=1 Tax=Powellomyces hirtus TaxID=109895 RepID=A0A507E9S7_9FUNG|nr:hypothetical protein PhCBS80983_g01711 [Powellomyces hirtus]
MGIHQPFYQTGQQRTRRSDIEAQELSMVETTRGRAVVFAKTMAVCGSARDQLERVGSVLQDAGRK